MAVQMTEEQFNQLLQRIQAPQAPQQQRSAAALGHMKPLDMGADKMRRLKKFNEWLEEAENRMRYIGATADEERISLLRSWGGQDLVNFMKLHAKVLFEPIPPKPDTTPPTPEIPKDTYAQTITKIRAELQRLVNRTLAMHELLTSKQGNRPWLEFYAEIETKARNLEFDTRPYTHKDAVKDALIMGMTDKKLMERALAEDPSHDTLMLWGQAREAGKEGVHNLSGGHSSANRIENFDDMSETEIEDMIETLSVMKIKKQGRYSGRPRRELPRPQTNPCKNCLSDYHPPGRCPANGKECFACGGSNHFSRSENCPKSRNTLKRVQYESNDTSEDYAETAMSHGNFPRENGVIQMISTVGRLATSQKSKDVTIKIGGVAQTLFTDTGSDKTIIPPSHYNSKMGRLVTADTRLRAWGSDRLLDVRGMVHTKLETEKGATTNTKVYVVSGYQPEPLLGDADAEALGFVVFNRDGREPTQEEQTKTVNTTHCIPEKVRQGLEVQVVTNRPGNPAISKEWYNKTLDMVQSYKGSVFQEKKVGMLECQPVSLPTDPQYKPTQPRFRNVPLHYQKKVSNLLSFLRENDVIEDVDPKEINDCILNVVITDKSDGDIRMNIDNTPLNPGMKRTKYHIQTPQEIRHELKEARIFSEMDMGWGFHHILLDQEARKGAVFQTHEGIHRMKRLYFGPTAASGIFHNEIRKAFTGLAGVTTLHDNILISGRTEEEHYHNLENCLKRCQERGIILKLSKSTFCKEEVKWFGRTFTPYGVAADQQKINSIKEKGRPHNIEDVRSLLMACQYNAKFTFDNPAVTESYEEITAPLRSLLKRNASFHWGNNEEESYQKLMNIMTSETTLRPYNINRKTHFIADASPVGMQASIYQEDERGTWLPVDHLSRALTPTEQKYSPIEKESLAQSWGMEHFRFYLIGSAFTSWCDHKPLIPLYNNRQSAVSKRIARHREQVQDLKYTMMHLPGKENPCDYGSRHPLPIEQLEENEKEKLGLNTGNEIYVRKLYLSTEDSPRALTIEDIKLTAMKDPTYNLLIKCIKNGQAGNRTTKDGGYHPVWNELCVDEDVVLKGNKIVIPDAEMFPGSGNLRTRILDIAHEGHQGCSAMKQYLRSVAWFPGMDKAVERKVSECIACQASTRTNHRDPLIPSTLPSGPWEKLSADHWGPLPDGKHLLVVIDEFSRYPEVAVVKGTSAEANIPALDEMFARHGFCRRLKSDGGPPFNGNENHTLQQYFRWAGITHKTTVSAEDPEANGLAEAFMKHLTKIYHTALIERRNPEAELNKHLRIYRATPHPTTGKPPSLLLFGRNIQTRLPTHTNHLTVENIAEHIDEARQCEVKEKEKQKMYKDNKPYVKPHRIHEGDQLLLSQIKTKLKPPYNPKPYTATNVRGHQITATRDNKIITRDAQKWKRITPSTPLNYSQINMKENQAIYAKENTSAEPLGYHVNDINHATRRQQQHQDPYREPNNEDVNNQLDPRDQAAPLRNDDAPPPRLYPERNRQRPDYMGVARDEARPPPQLYPERVAQIIEGSDSILHKTRRSVTNIIKLRQQLRRKRNKTV